MHCSIGDVTFDFYVIEISNVTHSHWQIIHPSETRKAHHSSVNKMINDSCYYSFYDPVLDLSNIYHQLDTNCCSFVSQKTITFTKLKPLIFH